MLKIDVIKFEAQDVITASGVAAPGVCTCEKVYNETCAWEYHRTCTYVGTHNCELHWDN